MSAVPTLRGWLDHAWETHADNLDPLAAELAQRAPTLPDDADGADAVRLAEHVLLAHRADAPALRAFLAALPSHPALAGHVGRAAWALAALDGGPEPDVPDVARWRALHAVVMTLVARGDVGAAHARLFGPEAAAAASADAGARKGYAATANNTAVDLCRAARGDAELDALMLDAAALARRAWERAGTWVNVERADHRLALCHAAVGDGAGALVHAAACLARCEAEGADAVERFFAHEAGVHACRAANDASGAERRRARMEALLGEIDDADMARLCAAALAAL